MELVLAPIEFRPNQVFDGRTHVVDVVAKQYLDKATADVHHLIPASVSADGNCLYHSIVLLMNNPTVTTSELRGIETNFCTLSNDVFGIHFQFERLLSF
jgi:hypothetical protein